MYVIFPRSRVLINPSYVGFTSFNYEIFSSGALYTGTYLIPLNVTGATTLLVIGTKLTSFIFIWWVAMFGISFFCLITFYLKTGLYIFGIELKGRYDVFPIFKTLTLPLAFIVVYFSKTFLFSFYS